MGVICSNKNKERNAKAANAANDPPKLQDKQEPPIVKEQPQTNANTSQHLDDKTQTQPNAPQEDTTTCQHKEQTNINIPNDNKQVMLQQQQTINRNNSGNNNLRQTNTKTDKLESKISEFELKHTATNTMSNCNADQLNTPSKKQIVAIDSNVFVSRGAVSPDDTYIKEKIVGKGSYGVVYLVKHKQLHRYFAMKIIKKRNRSKNDEEELMNEINILKKLDHPNILKINDFYSLKNEYSLMTEYCQEGELFNEIRAYAPFNEAIAGYYMKQILTAVCYCHSMNVLHRDLKPENILIVKRAKNGCHPIKIIDFGTAKVFSKGKNENLLIGSSYYIAPEVLSRNYTEKCDLWSCGVIMYILLTGRKMVLPSFSMR